MKAVIYYTTIDTKEQKKRLEHMTGEKLLETGLRREYGKDLRYEPRGKGEFGKPFFTSEPSIHYNISHSGKYVVCIFTGQAVGIDVQEHRPSNYERVLRRVVPAEMIPEILAAEDVPGAFYSEWVRREAYIKWTGQGLSRDMRTIPMNEGWCGMLKLEEGYSCAVWSQTPLDIRWEYVDCGSVPL